MRKRIRRRIAVFLISFFGIDYDWENDQMTVNKFGLRILTWVANKDA